MCIICDNTFFFSEKQRIQLNKKLDLTGIVEKAINQLYDDRKIDQPTKDALFVSHYEPLKQAINEGFDLKIEYGTPNYEFLKQLQTNTAVFAAFKSHASMKDMAARLKNDSGNLRSREDFKREAWKVDETYRGSKLDVEYDTGVRSARMAANWQRYQQNKRLYPNLRYMLSKAAKPDEKHLKFVGINLPIDDIFWTTHYPPNRWRCQCSAEPNDDDVTDVPENLPPVPEEFAFNSGKTGQVFDLKNSEYIKSVPPKEQPALIRKAKSYVVKDIAATTPYQTLYNSKSGGKVEAHPVTFNASDFDENVKASRMLANEKHTVRLLPTLSDKDLRTALFPKDVKANKNPDALIDGDKIADFKTITSAGKNTIKHALSSARQQCNNAVLVIPEDVSTTKYQAIKQVKEKAAQKEMKDFGEIWINYKGEWLYNPHK